MDGINELRGRMGGTADLSSLISGIMSDPALASTVASLASTLKSSAAGASESASEPDTAPSDEAVPREDSASESVTDASATAATVGALAPLLKGLSAGGAPDDPRTCLLRALKPYLSPGRREAIDHIITFSRLSGLFKSV
jgi:hypothetical protein